jgi:hypothetical protein
MARQVYADRASKVQERKRRSTNVQYMPGPIQHVVELVPKVPTLLGVLEELDGEKRGPLRPPSTCPSVARIVVHEGGVPATLPLFVVLGNLSQIPVLVDVVREDENACLGRVAKLEGDTVENLPRSALPVGAGGSEIKSRDSLAKWTEME